MQQREIDREGGGEPLTFVVKHTPADTEDTVHGQSSQFFPDKSR